MLKVYDTSFPKELLDCRNFRGRTQHFLYSLLNAILVKLKALQFRIISLLLMKMNILKKKQSPANLWNVTDGGAPGTFARAAFPQQWCREGKTQRSHANIDTCCKTTALRLTCSLWSQVSHIYHQLKDVMKGSLQKPCAGFIYAQTRVLYPERITLLHTYRQGSLPRAETGSAAIRERGHSLLAEKLSKNKQG